MQLKSLVHQLLKVFIAPFRKTWFTCCVFPVVLGSLFVFFPQFKTMSSQTFANLMQGLVGIGTLILAIAAILALNSWQQQRYYELGTNLLARLSEVQSRIRFYRLFGHLNNAERPGLRDQIYETGKELEKLFHLAIATWGDDIKTHKKTLANVIDQFSIKSKTYEDFSDGKLRSGIPATAIEKAKRIAVLDLWDDESTDEYTQQINSAVEALASFVREKMKG